MPRRKKMNRETVEAIFQRWQAHMPEPRTELVSSNHFTLLVAVVLSAQATDVGVNKATPALFAVADTPHKMAALGEEKLRDHIKTIGLYRSKARHIIALSHRLIEEYDGQVPATREALESLPGVGRKTANVILNCAFGQPTMAVDTHVFRVSNRIGLVQEKTVLRTEQALLQVIPARWMQHAHHWLILHGRYVCKARRPECERCAIADLCAWNAENRTQRAEERDRPCDVM